MGKENFLAGQLESYRSLSKFFVAWVSYRNKSFPDADDAALNCSQNESYTNAKICYSY